MQNLEQLKQFASELPDNVKEAALDLVERMGTVIEGIGDEPVTWRPPFLKIVQGTTDRSTIPKGTGIGDILLGEERVESPLSFIPLRLWKGRQYWDPNPENKKMLCQSPDAKMGYIGRECKGCPHAEWIEGQGSDCGTVMTMMAITADLKNIFIMNFAKTSYKVGLELESMLKKAGVAQYARTYGLGTKTVKAYEMFDVQPLDAANRRTPDALIPFLKALSDQIGADRKIALESFYKMLEDRKTSGAPQLEAGPVPAQLENSGNSSGADSTLPAEEETAEKKTSSKAKGYQV